LFFIVVRRVASYSSLDGDAGWVVFVVILIYGAFGVVGNEAFGAFWCCGMQEYDVLATEGLVREAAVFMVR
jgi:hypothetical protein